MVKEDFRGQEFRCAKTATRDMGFWGTVTKQPGNAKVAENNVTVRVEKDVLMPYVSVNDIMGMNVLDSKKLRSWIIRVRIIDSTEGLPVLTCRIVLHPRRVISMHAGFEDHLQGGTPISTMSERAVDWKTSVRTVTRYQYPVSWKHA